MRYYIAGPMTGIRNYNWPAFEAAAAKLRNAGHEVVSPTEIDEGMEVVEVKRDWSTDPATILDVRTTPAFDYDRVLAEDLRQLAGCSGIHLLRGWQQSAGACTELQRALELGLTVTHEHGALRYQDLFTPLDQHLATLKAARARVARLASGEALDVDEAEDRTNPKDRIGDTKPQMHLVPPAAVAQMAGVMKLGADKYGPYNWRENDVRLTVYISAAHRHLAALLDGEDFDGESGESHAAHAAACLAIVLDAWANENLIDDRPPPGAAPKVIAEMSAR